MNLPVLYSFRRCPYAMRARLALHYSGQAVELREVVLKNKPAEMLEVSSKGTVPVLVLADRVVDESVEIMQWALEQRDQELWLAGVDGSLLESALIQEHDEKFKPLLDKYKYFDRYPELSQEAYLQQAMPFLSGLNERVKANQGFLARETFSALDAAVFPFIRQFAHCDLVAFKQLDLSHLQRWLDACLTSDRFANVMKKYSAWSSQENNSIIFSDSN